MASPDRRHWLSPLTMVLFAATSVTGVVMWLHLRIPGLRLLHDTAGVLFTVAAALHLALNWRPFCACFTRRRAWLAVLTAVALCGALVLADLAHDDDRPRRGHGQARTPAGER